jgi:transcriptional regulator with AAA-type ATPase domain
MEKIFPIAMARSAFLPGLATQTHGSSGRSAALCARLCNHVPSLRERREDIPLLVAFLVQTFAQKLGKSVTQVFEGTAALGGIFVARQRPGNCKT